MPLRHLASSPLSAAVSGGEETADTRATEPAQTTGQATEDTEGEPNLPARILVTADWRQKRLSILDLDAFLGIAGPGLGAVR